MHALKIPDAKYSAPVCPVCGADVRVPQWVHPGQPWIGVCPNLHQNVFVLRKFCKTFATGKNEPVTSA